MTSFRARSVSLGLSAVAGGALLSVMSACFASPAKAACVQTGSDVDCTGNDFDGFRSSQSLTISINSGAFIQNEITNQRVGVCPLSYPAIQSGDASAVLNQGTISTAGVCGFGILVGRNGTVDNLGLVRTSDFVSYGIIGDIGSVIRNAGTITTEQQGSGGILAGPNSQIVNDTAGRIETSGNGASALESGTFSTIVNSGAISTSGDGALGIDAGAGSNVTNLGGVTTSANNSVGIGIAGGSLNNAGIIDSVLSGPAFALTPTVGVSIIGQTAVFTNQAAGSVTATHIGVRLSGTEGAQLTNAGRIETSPAIQFDGTISADGAAVLIAGSAAINITNAGAIVAHGGLPAIRSLGPRVELTNSGSIVGDISFADGDDTLFLDPASSIQGAIDFGAGVDTLVVRDGGILDVPVSNLEFFSMNGTSNFLIARDAAISSQVNVFGGGTLTVGDGVRLSAPAVDNLGTIRGFGIVQGSLANAGTVAPGTAAQKGSLVVTGAFRQFENGTLSVRLSPDGTSDRLMIGGPATLAGTLSVSYEIPANGDSFRDGQLFDVVAPLGGSLTTTGAFMLKAPDLAFVRAQIVQTAAGGFAVEIDRLPYEAAAGTEGQKSAARMLDGRPASLAETLSRLDAATPELAANILSGLAPETPGDVQTFGLLALDRFTTSIWKAGPRAPEIGRTAWVSGFTTSSRSRAASAAADYDLRGVIAGGDTRTGDWGFGFAVGKVTGDVDHGTGAADYGISLVAIRASYAAQDFEFDVGAAYGAGSPEMRRLRVEGPANEVLVASPGADLWSLSMRGVLTRSIGPVRLSPHAGLSFLNAHLGAFDEGVPLGLVTSAANASSLRARVGAGVTANAGRMRPYGDISVSVEALGRRAQVPTALNGAAGSGFTLYGEARRRFALEGEAGVILEMSERLEARLAGSLVANDLLAGRTLSAGLTFRW